MAMMDMAGFGPALKESWGRDELQELLYKGSPLFGLIPKAEDWDGDERRWTPMTSGTNGSADFPTAMLNRSKVALHEFRATRRTNYAAFAIGAQVALASRTNKGAAARALESQSKGALYEFKRSTVHQLYRNGGGARGQISAASNVATQTITLKDPTDIVFYEQNMKLQLASDDGSLAMLAYIAEAPPQAGALPRDGGEMVTVAALDRDLGTITISEASWSVIAGAAVLDYIFRAGDYGICLQGLDAYLPATAPIVADGSFNNVVRGRDPQRLAGIRVTQPAGSTMEDAVFQMLANANIAGAEPTHLFLHPFKMKALIQSLYGKCTYVPLESSRPRPAKDEEGYDYESNKIRVGYRAISFPYQGGEILVVADAACQINVGWALDLTSMALESLTEWPHWDMSGGSKEARQANEDGTEARARGYGDVIVYEPGHNARLQFAA